MILHHGTEEKLNLLSNPQPLSCAGGVIRHPGRETISRLEAALVHIRLMILHDGSRQELRLVPGHKFLCSCADGGIFHLRREPSDKPGTCTEYS